MRSFFEHPLVKIFFSVFFTFLMIFLAILVFSFIFSKTIKENSSIISENSIGVVEVKGVIRDSDKILKTLNDYAENDKIKAIIVKINSPGGGVVPSQEIYREIIKTKKKKPVYAYMQSLSASGGYYIACACNEIFANPGTITGSIGVILEFTNFEKLFDKLGIKAIVIKSGKFKDTGNPFRPVTDEEKQWLNEVVQNIYNQFLEAVSVSRKIPVNELKKIADGRIFTGKQALKYKLVDNLGNFSDLIEKIKKDLKLKEKPEIIFPEKKRNFLEKIIESTTDVVINAFQKSSFELKY